MHLNGDDRQVVIDSKLFSLLMAYAKDKAYELDKEDAAQVAAIQRHVIKFNPHVLKDIPLALQPAFLLEHQKEYARAIRTWACRSGTKAYLLMTADCGTEEHLFPVTVMGRSTLSPAGMRYVVVRFCNLNTEQEEALMRHRRVTGGVIRSGAKIKLGHHPITGPILLHACWMNDSSDTMSLAVMPSFLKQSPPEGAHECHGGLLDGVWRVPPIPKVKPCLEHY
jgi:hypothetical protein